MDHQKLPLYMITTIVKISMLLSPKTFLKSYSGLRKSTGCLGSFKQREDGGIFYNKDCMDYHIPVLGGIVKEPPMHIVHIAVEMTPIAKVVLDINGVDTF
ncbi:hypothetical protein V6N13_053094 [Hibiscus sabdariffa]